LTTGIEQTKNHKLKYSITRFMKSSAIEAAEKIFPLTFEVISRSDVMK
jgi:hypothetical protein